MTKPVAFTSNSPSGLIGVRGSGTKTNSRPLPTVKGGEQARRKCPWNAGTPQTQENSPLLERKQFWEPVWKLPVQTPALTDTSPGQLCLLSGEQSACACLRGYSAETAHSCKCQPEWSAGQNIPQSFV